MISAKVFPSVKNYVASVQIADHILIKENNAIHWITNNLVVLSSGSAKI